MRYLTNMTKSDDLEARVTRTSALTGLDVRYHDHPMPADDWDDDGYNPDQVPDDASLAYHGSDMQVDLSEWWRVFESL